MYDQEKSVVVDALKQSSATVFDQSTIDRILNLTTNGSTDNTVTFNEVTTLGGNVTVSAGTEVAYINSSATTQTVLTAPLNVPVVVFQGLGGVNATFNDGQATVSSGAGVADRVIVGSAGADKIVILDGLNSQVTIGAGDTVVAGTGNDTVVAGMGNSTIVGGTHTIVQLGGGESDYKIDVANGHAVVTNIGSGVATDLSKIQYVQLDNSQALIFAKDTVEAAVTTLYQTAFGRTADASGLQYWFDVARSGTSLSDIADAFAASAEFAARALDNTKFVQSLYHNTFARAGEDSGIAYWVDALAHGSTRGDLIEKFAQIAAYHIDGSIQGEASIVGSVTIIPGTIV